MPHFMDRRLQGNNRFSIFICHIQSRVVIYDLYIKSALKLPAIGKSDLHIVSIILIVPKRIRAVYHNILCRVFIDNSNGINLSVTVFIQILVTVCLAAIVIHNVVSILDRLVYGIRPIGAQLVHAVGFFTTCFITDWIICTVTGIVTAFMFQLQGTAVIKQIKTIHSQFV